jgi:hypothetical protein
MIMGDREIMAVDLKQHAHGRLITIRYEYEHKIKEWQDYLSMYAGALGAAHRGHVDTLKDARERQKADAELAMLALSIVGGLSIVWIKTLVRTKLYPKFAGKTEWKDVFTTQGWEMKATRHWNEVRADFLGDAAEKMLDIGLDKAVESILPKPLPESKEPLELINAIVQYDPDIFERQVNKTVRDETDRMFSALGIMHTNIDNQPNFGGAVLDAAANQSPHFKRMAVSQQSGMAKEMMDASFDKLRRGWARSWHYYGNQPHGLGEDELARKLEKAIWALWILDQQYKVVEHPDRLIGRLREVEGKDGFHLDGIIMGRLHEELQVWGLGDALDHTRSRGVFGTRHSDIEPEDLADVISWAKTTPPRLFNKIDYIPRPFVPIREAATVFRR